MSDLMPKGDRWRVEVADCLAHLGTMPDGCADAVVTDPPYGLEFMGKDWDKFGGGKVGKPGIGDRETPWVSNGGWNHLWCRKCGHLPNGGSPCRCEQPDIRAADDRWHRFQAFNRQWATATLRVLKPGGYMLCFGGTRTYHRLACAVEDAGFEVRDCLMWLYGTGFPKGKGCLKPGYEPILLCRRPGPRVLPLGIDGCRVPLTGEPPPRGTGDRRGGAVYAQDEWTQTRMHNGGNKTPDLGRWPANVLHDGSDEVLEAFPNAPGQSGAVTGQEPSSRSRKCFRLGGERSASEPRGDSGSAARFFWSPKADRKDRGKGNSHPTVKPTELMRWLVRLVCPVGGLALDPFGGSGTTGVACIREGRRCVLVERDPAYAAIAVERLATAERAYTPPLFAS